MSIKSKFRRYVSNIISFANSRARNSLRDRSDEFYSGEVTPELEHLMRKVWQPLIDPDQEVIVIRLKKPRTATSLGLTIEGVDEVRRFSSSKVHSTELDTVTKSRHFVRTIVPDGLIGSLDIIRPGDELLQVNGRRLRGTSHTNTVRSLRNLPTHIELVLARSITSASKPIDFPMLSDSMISPDDAPIEVLASEVNSVDTIYAKHWFDEVDSTHQTVSPHLSHSRVSDWIHRSVNELRSNTLPSHHSQGATHSVTSNGINDSAQLDPYQYNMNDKSIFTPSIGMNHYTTASTLGRSSGLRVRDLRYGTKRPVWSDVPLLIQLTKTPEGFGFSLSEYAELEVADTDVTKPRKSLTLSRRSRDNRRVKLQRSHTLPRSWSHTHRQSHKHGYLLVDSITPNGLASQDGRISVGDRLLFINDRNLSKATLREAAAALRAAPNGPCLLGVSKMHFEDNVLKSCNASIISPVTIQDTLSNGYEPLYVNTMGFSANTSKDIHLTHYPDDHPLDFHTLPTNKHDVLHSHTLILPPVDKQYERSVCIPLLSRPIGIKLDAHAAGGQDGCRIVDVLLGGAVAQSGLLKPNDYIVRLNDQNLRGVTNVEAFECLRHCSNTQHQLEIVYIPASSVIAHRSAHMSLVPPSSTLLPNNNDPSMMHQWWTHCERVILRRDPNDNTWGLECCGKELLTGTVNFPEAIATKNPTFVKRVLFGSPAYRCGQIQPGDMILKVGDIDVSNAGVQETNAQLRRHLISGICELDVYIRCGTAAITSSTGDEEIKRTFTVAEVEHRRSSTVDPNEPGTIGFRGIDSSRPLLTDLPIDPHGMEVPEPVSELESRDEVNVLFSRTTTSRTNENFTDSSEECPNLALIPCPVLDETLDNLLALANELTALSSTTKSIPSPIENELDALPIATADPVTLYRRDDRSDEEIISLTLAFPISTKLNDKSHLGLRLSSDGDGTYVTGFTSHSTAAQTAHLRVGDEIVQVDQFNVSGQTPSVVRSCIYRVLNRTANRLNGCKNLFLVIRRKSTRTQPMSTPVVSNMTVSPPKLTDSPVMNHGEPLLTSTVCNGVLASDKTHDKFLEQVAMILGESPDLFDLIDVELHRNKDGFGLFLVNYGPDFKGGIFISELAENGAAALQSDLRPHDRILAVNGILQTDYDTSLQLLKQCTPSVRLTIGRRKPATPIVPGKETLIELHHAPGMSLGLLVVGGKGTALEDILVHSLRKGGAVALDGRLEPGDHLLAVNGISLRGVDLDTAKGLLTSKQDRLQLLVYREAPSSAEVAAPSSEYIEVKLRRSPGQNLGLSLISRSPYNTGTAIAAVNEGTPAAVCGQLLPGDILVEINGIDVRSFTVQEVTSLVKQCANEVRVKVNRPTSPNLPSCPPLRPSHRLDLYVVVLRRTNQEVSSNEPYTNQFMSSPPGIGFSQPLLGPSNVNACFGLFLRQATTDEVRTCGGQLIVEDVLPGSPAALSIMILPGDRLLTVDREPVDWLQPDEVFSVLSQLYECTLELGRLPTRPYPIDPGLSQACYPHTIHAHSSVPVSCSTPVNELPCILTGEMPTTDLSLDPLHTMNVLPEEEDVIAINPLTHVVPCDDNSVNTVQEAIRIAERATCGFQVRQLTLPLASQTRDMCLGVHLCQGTGISGPVVVHIQPNSPAYHAGLRIGDRLLGVDNKLLMSLYSPTQTHQLIEHMEMLWQSRDVETNPIVLTVISPTNEVIRDTCNGRLSVSSTCIDDPAHQIESNTREAMPSIDPRGKYETPHSDSSYGPSLQDSNTHIGFSTQMTCPARKDTEHHNTLDDTTE